MGKNATQLNIKQIPSIAAKYIVEKNTEKK
jgi:hypothetical protein